MRNEMVLPPFLPTASEREQTLKKTHGASYLFCQMSVNSGIGVHSHAQSGNEIEDWNNQTE